MAALITNYRHHTITPDGIITNLEICLGVFLEMSLTSTAIPLWE